MRHRLDQRCVAHVEVRGGGEVRMIHRHFGGNHRSHVGGVVSSGGRKLRRDGRMWGLGGLSDRLHAAPPRPHGIPTLPCPPSRLLGLTTLGRLRCAALVLAVASVVALSGCDSHSSSPGPATGSATSNSTGDASHAVSTTATPSGPTSSAPSSSDRPSPPVSSTSTDSGGSSATQTYLAYNAWVAHAAMNPADPNLKALAGLASGSAYSDALKNLNTSIIWKGKPASPRVRVTSVQSGGAVVDLVDCALPGTLLPYYVSTGKPVPQQKNPVPPPYATSVQVVKLKDHWSVTQASTNRSKTCSP